MIEWLAIGLPGAVLGIGIGYLIWARALFALRARHDALDADHRKAATDLAAAHARAEARDRDSTDLAHERGERERLSKELAALEAGAAARERSMAEQREQLVATGAALKAQFEELAAAALRGTQAHFLEVAEETMKRHRTAADAELARSKADLTALLAPVGDTLTRYEAGLKAVETAREQAYGGLRDQIEAMRVETVAVRGETAKLANVLRASPKARGRWGEMALRNVLERAGLTEHCDFAREVSVDTGDGRLRPDVVVRLPGGRSLIIDAKCAFNAYEDAANAPDEGERLVHLKAHAGAMRRHAEALSRKAYWDQFPDAPDYVVMFVSGEQFLSAAFETDPALWEDAFEKRVLLAGPMHLVGIARTVAAVWRQEKLARDAASIGIAGRELYERVATMGEHIRKLGAGIRSAVDNYNGFVGSLEGKVLPKARAIRALNIEPPKSELADLAPIETVPRQLSAPEFQQAAE